MASVGNIVFCATLMLVIWAVLGAPAAARIAPSSLSWLIAPALGWSIHSAVAFPLFCAIGLSRWSVLVTTSAFVLLALAALFYERRHWQLKISTVWLLTICGAAVLASVPMMALLPKEGVEGIALSAPIFDHSKIALVAEMIRSGVPATNPFFGEIGASERVSYYYLWHLSAAGMAVATGVTAWEADAALTWFTAFASLLAVIGFATWISGRASAGLVAVAIGAAASARPVVEWLLGTEGAHSLIRWSTGFGGWLFQTSWAPQHVAAATSAVLAGFVLVQMPARRNMMLVLLLALLTATAFESSAWIGLTFAIAAIAIGLRKLVILPTPQRIPFLLCASIAGVLAVTLASLFIYDQITTMAIRDSGSPITVAPVLVLGDAFPESVRRLIDLPAYWLIFLPIEFPSFYPAGIATLVLLLLRTNDQTPERRNQIFGLALMILSSLAVAWLLVSDLGGNNDLGWRAVLPAVLLLMAFAAAGISRWTATWPRIPAFLSSVGLLIGLPEGASLFADSLFATPRPSAAVFANSSATWTDVRQHSSRHERIANNPSFVQDVTPWPVNISWALLADRRSCYAGFNLAIAFAPISAARREGIDRQFARVFDGNPEPEDVPQMAKRYRCDVIVITPEDGAWVRDPFASSDLYTLVQSEPNAWRIYRKVNQPTNR